MKEKTLVEFSSALAGKVPVPGGGGAAALAGALAAALGSMVGSYTVGKPEFSDLEEELALLMEEATEIRETLLTCIDEDAEGFEPLSKAYRLPSDSPGRDEIMEKCLRAAAAVPMKVAALSCRAIELSEQFSEKGNRMLGSDAGCSAALGRAALYSAVLNVRVNTQLMKDRVFAESLNNEADRLMERGGRLSETVFEGVLDSLR